MQITERLTGKGYAVTVEPVVLADYKRMVKRIYFFNWKTEKRNSVYKLRRKDSDTILGLISLINYTADQRLEIKLLAVSKENRGRNKQFEGIAGILIGYACKEALKYYGIIGCVSLVPKTELKKHYIKQYGMIDAGRQIFLEGKSLLKMVNTYLQ